MLLTRPAGKHAGTHRAAATRAGNSNRLIDGRYKRVERAKTTTPGCRRWVAHDLRLNRMVLIELRRVHAATTPDDALRAHIELFDPAPTALLDAGFWPGRHDRPVTYVVTPAPTLAPAISGARRRARRRGVAQVA